MTIHASVHCEAGATFRSHTTQGQPVLTIQPDGPGGDDIDLFIGSDFTAAKRGHIIDQLRQLHRAVAVLAEPYGGLLALLGPDDDEDEDEPAPITSDGLATVADFRSVGLLADNAARQDGDHFAYPDSLRQLPR